MLIREMGAALVRAYIHDSMRVVRGRGRERERAWRRGQSVRGKAKGRIVPADRLPDLTRGCDTASDGDLQQEDASTVAARREMKLLAVEMSQS